MRLSILLVLYPFTISPKLVSDAFTTPVWLSSRKKPSLLTFQSEEDAFVSSSPYRHVVVMKSSQYTSMAPTPNDERIREEYSKWRRRFGKGDFDPVRYDNFKANFLAVTARNNMERNRARQNGETAPSPIQLNEYGDCSAGEYRQAMTQQQQQQQQQINRNGMGGPIRAQQQSNSNDVSNPISNSSMDRNLRNNGTMSRATSQLRSVVKERRSLESELVQLKQQLEEKKKLLQNAAKEEQDCKGRIALREEQKRILNDRLTNGWDDEPRNVY